MFCFQLNNSFTYMSEQTFAGIFQQIDDSDKTGIVSVVRIGHRIYSMEAAIIRYFTDFLSLLFGPCPFVQCIYILIIHANNVVKSIKIGIGQRPRDMRYVVAPLSGMISHPCIRFFAFVKINETGRIHFKILRQIIILQQFTEYCFGHG